MPMYKFDNVLILVWKFYFMGVDFLIKHNIELQIKLKTIESI